MRRFVMYPITVGLLQSRGGGEPAQVLSSLTGLQVLTHYVNFSLREDPSLCLLAYTVVLFCFALFYLSPVSPKLCLPFAASVHMQQLLFKG